MKRIAAIFLGGCLLASQSWAGEIPVLNLLLAQAETQAEQHSSQLQAKAFELDALRSRADTQSSLLWPRLTLEASYRYLSEIPDIKILPNAPEFAFGDHNNYSVGPMLAWNIWDSGGTYFTWRSAQALARAKEDEFAAQKRALRLRTRLAYFQTQLALAQVSLLTDQAQLSQAQYQDIHRQSRAGQASRIDLLSSHQDVINSRRQLRLAQTDLSAALRDLLNTTGGGEAIDPARPAEAGTTPAAEAAPSVWLALDSLDVSLVRLGPAAQSRVDPHYPSAQVFHDLTEASRYSADSLGTGHWPKLQISAKTSLDYPNGPVLETVHQNTLAISASWSLFEFNRIVNQVAEQQHTADMNAHQAEQAETDLDLNWRKAQDQLAQYQDIRKYDEQAVQETVELARLVYQAYRTGRSSYLEVQSANTRALAAKIQSVRTRMQMLMQLALLESLAQQVSPADQSSNGK